MARFGCIFTCCFALSWLLVIAGTVKYHLAVAAVLPLLRSFPATVAEGFGGLFGLSDLERGARAVLDGVEGALRHCDDAANVSCLDDLPVEVPGRNYTSSEQEAALDALRRSLADVRKMAGDEYFGTAEVQRVARLTELLAAGAAELNGTADCGESAVVYCDLYHAGSEALSLIHAVQLQLSNFTRSEAAETLSFGSRSTCILHGLSCPLVLAMISLSYYWCGESCRRKSQEALPYASFALIPFACFWTAAFMLSLSVNMNAAWESSAQASLGEVMLPVLRGGPPADAVLRHVEAALPRLWAAAFAEVAAGLEAWAWSSWSLWGLTAAVALYAVCLWTCRPYRKSGLVVVGPGMAQV